MPLIPCYFLLKPVSDFASAPIFWALPDLTALILFLRTKASMQKSTTRNAQKFSDVLWIGAMQSAALIPGISRSASTISCAKVLGWDAREAVRFSFLLSIPTVIGGNCLELLKITLSHETPASVSLSACAVGFCLACLWTHRHPVCPLLS